MVVICECDEICRVIAPTIALESRCLWDQYVELFRSRPSNTDWDFINREVYGDFDNLSLASDIDSMFSSSGSIEITMELSRASFSLTVLKYDSLCLGQNYIYKSMRALYFEYWWRMWRYTWTLYYQREGVHVSST